MPRPRSTSRARVITIRGYSIEGGEGLSVREDYEDYEGQSHFYMGRDINGVHYIIRRGGIEEPRLFRLINYDPRNLLARAEEVGCERILKEIESELNIAYDEEMLEAVDHPGIFDQDPDENLLVLRRNRKS